MQHEFADRYKPILEVTNDEEWAAIKPLVQRVMAARLAGSAGTGLGMMGALGRGGLGGDTVQIGLGGGRTGIFGQNMPEAEALRKLLEAKAPKAEIKAALAKFVSARQAKQDELRQVKEDELLQAKQDELRRAQDSLREVLTARQEAAATLNGLL